MSTFKVEAEREVITIERASIMIEAASQKEAETIAPSALAERIEGDMDLVWMEDVDLASIGEAVVTSTTLHAFDEETAPAQ